MGEKYKEYRKKWDDCIVQEKCPIHLDLEITTKCDLNCIMCARRIEHTKPMDMDLDLAKQIIKEFASKGGLAIKFCYLGEPTLYPHLVEVVKYAKELGIVDTRIATNGTSLDENLARELIKAGLDFIIFSVDSMFPHIYEKIRIGGDLFTVVKNIRTLKYLRDRQGLDKPKIQVQIIPMELNKYELETKAYYKFYEKFADKVWESPWCKDFSNVYTANDEQPDFFCPSPYRRLLIRADGQIWLCCGDPLKEKYIGTFPEMSIEEAWNSDYMKDVREKMTNGQVHLIDVCKKCSERWYKQ